jgi:ubiquinone/menaquinone biosynthesis C-methylase UbiE
MDFEVYKVGCSNDMYIPIHDSWNVIEIGGGANPCPRADVITNYNSEFHQRGMQPKKVDGAVMLELDCHDMSCFDDNEFDYLLCIQVAEHLERPDVAIKEMTRIAKKGLIQVPSALTETIMGFNFHKWIIHEIGDKLIFQEKEPIHEEYLGMFFHNMFYKQNPLQQRFKEVYFAYSKLFLINRFFDESGIDVEVIRNDSD